MRKYLFHRSLKYIGYFVVATFLCLQILAALEGRFAPGPRRSPDENPRPNLEEIGLILPDARQVQDTGYTDAFPLRGVAFQVANTPGWLIWYYGDRFERLGCVPAFSHQVGEPDFIDRCQTPRSCVTFSVDLTAGADRPGETMVQIAVYNCTLLPTPVLKER
jgi:hypothetical protein